MSTNNRYIHTKAGDAMLIEGWPAGEPKDKLLARINAMLAMLDDPTIQPMTLNGMMKRIRAFNLKRPPGFRAEAAIKMWHEKLKHTPKKAHPPMCVDVAALPLNIRTPEIARVLTGPRDGTLSVAVFEIAREMREQNRCRIDRESALAWGQRWNYGEDLAAINKGRLENGLPIFELI